MRVLLLGAGGQLGKLVARQAPPHVELSAYTSAVCDITDTQSLANALGKSGPDLIINCAAYTQVDKAESERDKAWAVNAEAVNNIINASAARIIHVSTDFVFDGTAQLPYATDAECHPLGVYGESKRAGELALTEQAADRSVIIRTAWLYSADGQNFMNAMLRLMASKDELSIVADQRGTPTSASGLAQAIWAFADLPESHGIFHWTDAGEASWYEFAREIQRQAVNKGLLQREIPLLPITTAQYPTAAKRPAYSVLDKSSTWQALGLKSRPWQEMLSDVLDALKLKQAG